jgi:adenylate kinase
MKIIMLGAPASGKGTVAAKLAKEFNYLHVSAGQLLRDEIDKGTKLGEEIKGIVEKGDLVPDDLVTQIVSLVIKRKDKFILDGFPRTIHQAKNIKNFGINKVIYLKLSEDTAVERISGRRVCKNGHTYHIKYIPSKKEGYCDIDGSKLFQRKDDNEITIRERFKIYLTRTKPLIEYYDRKGLLTTIDGTPKPDTVYGNVKKVMS